MPQKSWIKVMIFLSVFLLAGGLMVSASPAEIDSEVVTATTYNTTIIVNSGQDLDTSGTGIRDGELVTLRRAINAARGAVKPVLIEFDIPTSCPSYNSNLDIWKIELRFGQMGTPSNTTFRALNGDITIDGTTQNGRADGPTIILYGDGATGARNCMVLGGTAFEGGNVIKGLGFQNFRDSITVSSVNNKVEDCWFGLNDEGTGPLLRGNNQASGSGGSGVVFSGLNNIDGNSIVQNNKFLGLNERAAAIRGWENTFRNNWIGMAADGTVINPGCTPDNWLGGQGISVEGRKHTIEENRFAGLRFEQFGMSQPPDAIAATAGDWANAGHIIRNNIIGLDINDVEVGTCGRGITANNHMRGTLIENNIIVKTSLAGIWLNGGQYNQCELKSNILRGTFIELGEGLPDAFVEFVPPIVTNIDGTTVTGTGGNGSSWVELFLDESEEPVEALESLARVQADEDGNWTADLPYELTEGQGIRTTLTSTKFGIIPGMLSGTTSGLSELYPSQVVPGPVDTYKLTFAANPAAGGTATDVTGKDRYEAGEVVTIRAVPTARYDFSHWSAPAGSFANANVQGTRFTMPAQDVIVTANFRAKPVATTPGPNREIVEGRVVEFRWHPVAGAVRYVLTAINVNNPSDVKRAVITDGTSVSIGNFPNDGSEYRWRIRPISAAGPGRWSNFRFFSSGTLDAPGIVYPSRGQTVPGNEITFEWEEVNGALRYIFILLDGDGNRVPGARASLPARDGLSYTPNLPGVFTEEGEEFVWRMRAWNRGGLGDLSEGVSFNNSGSAE